MQNLNSVIFSKVTEKLNAETVVSTLLSILKSNTECNGKHLCIKLICDGMWSNATYTLYTGFVNPNKIANLYFKLFETNYGSIYSVYSDLATLEPILLLALLERYRLVVRDYGIKGNLCVYEHATRLLGAGFSPKHIKAKSFSKYALNYIYSDRTFVHPFKDYLDFKYYNLTEDELLVCVLSLLEVYDPNSQVRFCLSSKLTSAKTYNLTVEEFKQYDLYIGEKVEFCNINLDYNCTVPIYVETMCLKSTLDFEPLLRLFLDEKSLTILNALKVAPNKAMVFKAFENYRSGTAKSMINPAGIYVKKLNDLLVNLNCQDFIFDKCCAVVKNLFNDSDKVEQIKQTILNHILNNAKTLSPGFSTYVLPSLSLTGTDVLVETAANSIKEYFAKNKINVDFEITEIFSHRLRVFITISQVKL